jgi:hypothetical protein
LAGGRAERHRRSFDVRGGTPQGCQICYFSDRWYRFAQPPANCFSAFGAHCRFDRGNTDPDTTIRSNANYRTNARGPVFREVFTTTDCGLALPTAGDVLL